MEDQELAEIERDLQNLFEAEGGGYENQESKDQLLNLERKCSHLLKKREESWCLKRRSLWLRSGDENTKFFQAFAKGRRMENTIWSLNDSEGNKASSFQDMAQMSTRHFRNLFKEDSISQIEAILGIIRPFPRFVEEEDNRELMKEVKEEELKEIIFSFQKDKSPGPDGWSMEFFMGLYGLIGKDILKVVEESRKNGHVHDPFNATFLALIPKVDNLGTLEDFRPISLCNRIYKII
jgi:hypothetical protein